MMGTSRLRSLIAGSAMVTVLGTVQALPGDASAAADPASPVASAVVRNQQGLIVGQVSFQQVGVNVQVRAVLAGIEPRADFHGMHIHANGACDGDFTSAGGHWNPLGANHGDHVGDMVTVYADDEGRAATSFVLDTFTVGQLLSDD